MSKNILSAVSALGALVGLAASPPANAQIQFAVFNPEPSNTGGVVNFKVDKAGHLSSASTSTPTIFTFDVTPLANFGDLQSTFDFSANETAPATSSGGVVEATFGGSFDFFYSGPTVTQGGVTLTTGELLLNGTFSDASFLATASASGGGLTDDSIVGTVAYTSAIPAAPLPLAATGQSFTLGFIDISPLVAVEKSMLRHFQAIGDGKFSADMLGGGGGGGVPEPAAWTLMLVGVGAVGLIARRRRKAPTIA